MCYSEVGFSRLSNDPISGDTVLPRERSRATVVFICQTCGHESPRWMGFCPSCGEHAPLVETTRAPTTTNHRWRSSTNSKLEELSQISHDEQERIPLGFAELNRVLGGGVVPGSVVLMAGEPGIGKSTLLLQTAEHVAAVGNRVLYVTGEESSHQIKLRSERLGITGQGVFLLAETDVDQVVVQLEGTRPALAMVDSIQTLYAEGTTSGQGSAAQVRECALRLMRWAKDRAVPVLLAGHVTKNGSVAGPRVMEHMVDVVLYMEGENLGPYRILRGTKNRFGSTNEVGIFQMGDRGLEEIHDPSRVLLSERRGGSVGSAIVPILEGNRPLLVEVQALTSPSALAVPRRVANGVDYNRLLMLTAVLSRRVGFHLSNQDVIVNVVGGLRIREPSSDLAIALAIGSSLRNVALSPEMVAFGEVGLSGELRTGHQLGRRLSEATRLGFRKCILPASAKQFSDGFGEIEPFFSPTLSDALEYCVPRPKVSQGYRPPADFLGDQT